MALDPDAERVLELVRLSGRPTFDQVSPAEARALFLAGRNVFAPEPAPVAEIRDLAAPGPGVGSIPLRLYRPGEGVLPALVYYHGGGWVVGDLETHDTLCRHLANAAGCAVVAVDYRLAPEHKFPAAVEDAWAALEWVAENGAALGIDRARLAVGGDSAGGNLAAVASLIARDRGGPLLSCQLLLYPAVDLGMHMDSYRRFAEGYLLTRATMAWFVDHYLARPAEIDDWRGSPLRAADLGGVAPAFVVTAGYDPLSDEGAHYARRLVQSGVSICHRHYAGMLHGFLTAGRIVRAAGPALDEAAAALKAAW
ncbi:MAG TPA: alpha/beta hydrolase [Stellaceae bacterium]|nr:alpha/beta hydrolase [Stellaceae bacterium]